ncbi:MAG: alcohol dehydrogenase catalytic domain-containing protein [Planctomycetes bacterium]|nr:alcohol dehydrogenase catalytic domain-containing protein [Planctomycetota bacterium]
MPNVTFEALDYTAERTFAAARYRIDGDARGFTVWRNGERWLELGPGYRLLRTRACGVCSTDLARHHLPFPLPQVIGHEVLGLDERGERYVVEINASHHARGLADACPFCRSGLPTHCPARRTLGIHDLPGGFGPWFLAPVDACLPVPANVPDSAAVLVEPFAAALHAVRRLQPRAGERLAVLGPRRLGMLVLAALAGVRAERPQGGEDFGVVALVRDPQLAAMARTFGATDVHVVDDRASDLPDGAFDAVLDTTGNPDALATAVRLARREVHLKSTHGQPSCGLGQLTGLVVDELSLAPFPRDASEFDASCANGGERPRIAWLPVAAPPAWLLADAEVLRGSPAELAIAVQSSPRELPHADLAVAANAAEVDAAIRPVPGRETSLVRPRGTILVQPSAATTSPLLDAITSRSLRLSSSRCGDFRSALALLAANPELQRIGERLISHRFAARDLPAAFAMAGSRASVKVVVDHDAPARDRAPTIRT